MKHWMWMGLKVEIPDRNPTVELAPENMQPPELEGRRKFFVQIDAMTPDGACRVIGDIYRRQFADFRPFVYAIPKQHREPPDPTSKTADPHSTTTVALLVYVDLDPIPGPFHTGESAANNVRGILEKEIDLYKPRVELAPDNLQPTNTQEGTN